MEFQKGLTIREREDSLVQMHNRELGRGIIVQKGSDCTETESDTEDLAHQVNRQRRQLGLNDNDSDSDEEDDF